MEDKREAQKRKEVEENRNRGKEAAEREVQREENMERDYQLMIVKELKQAQTSHSYTKRRPKVVQRC